MLITVLASHLNADPLEQFLLSTIVLKPSIIFCLTKQFFRKLQTLRIHKKNFFKYILILKAKQV